MKAAIAVLADSGQIASAVVSCVTGFVVNILPIAFTDFSCTHHFTPGSIALGAAFLLLRAGMIHPVFPAIVSFFHNLPGCSMAHTFASL